MLTIRQKMFVLFVVFTITLSIVPDAQADDSLRVFYAGKQGSVKTALELAEFDLVSDPEQADVFVLNGEIPNLEVIRPRIAQGAGLVLLLGPNLSEQQVSDVLGIPLGLTARDDAVSLTNLQVKDPLLTEIRWNSAPQVRERFDTITPVSSVQPLVTSYETSGWILWRARPNEYVFSAFLDDANPQIQDWAYFNYLIYHLVERAAGRTPLPFAEYSVSPVPHAKERNLLFAIMALMLVTTFGAFYLVRRYSRNHPEALDQIVSDRSRFEVHEEATGWEQVGFHRPPILLGY